MGTPRRHQRDRILRDFLGRLVAKDSATEPQFELAIPIPVPDAATGDIDIVLKQKFEVVDVIVEKRGGATGAFANTIQVKNGATAISDAMSLNGVADGGRVTWATLDDAQSTISEGGTLRITRTKAGGNAQCRVVVRGFIRA
jgi:hypothetical protein